MLMNYLRIGITYFIISIPIAVICILIYNFINSLITKKNNVIGFKFMCQAAWLDIIISILGITGIFNTNYDTTFILDGNTLCNLKVFEDGVTPATVLNIILFIPYGFLSTILFKNIRTKMVYGILIGFAFSVGIEFIQIFTGRFVELEDILMNTLGTYIGYSLCIVVVKFKNKKSCKTLGNSNRNQVNI